MANMLSFRVTRASDSIPIFIHKDSLIDDLIKAVCDKVKDQFQGGLKPEDLFLNYMGKPLKFGENKRLADYGLTTNGSTLVMGVRAEGGIWPLEAVKEMRRTLAPLPGYIQVTTTEADMITLDDSDELRAKMPCGHVIGPASMTQYCYSLLDSNIFTFPCPALDCGRLWEYFMVRHVACLTAEEQSKFEAKVAEKYMSMSCNFQQCPGCRTLCCRADTKNIRVHCGWCSKSNDSSYDFCWACSRQWLTGGTDICGNTGCDGKDPRLRILREAPRKEINKIVDCPSIRACPKCGLLIYHKEGCRHMTCYNCKTKFCFICMQVKECSLSSKCPVAPPQSTIVGSM